MAKFSYTQEQKLFLVHQINENKELLFGPFDESTSRNDKMEGWKSIYNAALSQGIGFPKGWNYTYQRDVFWPNTRRSAMVRLN